MWCVLINRLYRLEVVQSPSRGRTCGFGDADRRALSAPLIARLRVYDALTDELIPAEYVLNARSAFLAT